MSAQQFIVVNTLYNMKPLVGLPTQNLAHLEGTGSVQSMANIMKQSEVIQGYEQSYTQPYGKIYGPN